MVQAAERVLADNKSREGQYRTAAELAKLSVDALEAMLLPKGYALPESSVHELGEGMFGSVLMVRRVADSRLFAAKRQLLGDVASEAVPVLREITILNALRGASNIVQIEDSLLLRPAENMSAEVWSILELFPHNISDMRYCFKAEEWARRAMFQVLCGLSSLHSSDIIHRDLKLENILLDFGDAPPLTLKAVICDFGVARSIHDFPSFLLDIPPLMVPERRISEGMGNVMCEPPEMSGWADTSQMTKCDLKSRDIFAYGIIWADLLAGQCIFKESSDDDPPN